MWEYWYGKIKYNRIETFKKSSKKLNRQKNKRKCKYKIWDIVCVALLAVIANCNEWEEIEIFAKKNKEWLRKFLLMTGGIPSAQTYERVISMLEPNEINKICIEFSRILTKANKTKKEDFK